MSSIPTDLAALREQKLRELAEVRLQLAAARQRLADAAVEYAATSDGLCETYRRFELASGAERDELRAAYLGGLSLADQEFQRRCALGHARDEDGPLQALPVGSFDDPLGRALIERQIMGWARVGRGAHPAVVVGVMRLLPDQRTRERLRLRDSADPLLGTFTSTLPEVLRRAWADAETRAKVQRFLGTHASVVGGLIT